MDAALYELLDREWHYTSVKAAPSGCGAGGCAGGSWLAASFQRGQGDSPSELPQHERTKWGAQQPTVQWRRNGGDALRMEAPLDPLPKGDGAIGAAAEMAQQRAARKMQRALRRRHQKAAPLAADGAIAPPALPPVDVRQGPVEQDEQPARLFPHWDSPDGISAFTRAGRPCLTATLSSKRRVWHAGRAGPAGPPLRVHAPKGEPGVPPKEAEQLLAGDFWKPSLPPQPPPHLDAGPPRARLLQRLRAGTRRLAESLTASTQQLSQQTSTALGHLNALLRCCLVRPALGLTTRQSADTAASIMSRVVSLGQSEAGSSFIAAQGASSVAALGGQDVWGVAPPPAAAAPPHPQHDDPMQPPLPCLGDLRGSSSATPPRAVPLPAAPSSHATAGAAAACGSPQARVPLGAAAASWPGRALVPGAHHRTYSTPAEPEFLQQVWGRAAEELSEQLAGSGSPGSVDGAGLDVADCVACCVVSAATGSAKGSVASEGVVWEGNPERQEPAGGVGKGQGAGRVHKASEARWASRAGALDAPLLLPVDSASDMQLQHHQQQQE